MPEIEIRPVIPADIPHLIAIDHDYTTEYVWQMEIQADAGQVGVSFRQVRLPRSVRVDYPRSPRDLINDWSQRSGILVALLEGQVIAYTSLMLNITPAAAWMTDLAVVRRLRRQSVGSALVLAAQDWARQRGTRRIIMEMQPKNYPAICMAQKLGFDFCGYNDCYYANHDIALFFGKSV